MRVIGSFTGGLALAGLFVAAGGLGSAWAGEEPGKAIYEKSCKACHSVAGEGGKMAHIGGALDGVGAKRDAEWLKKYLQDPKATIPNAKMPKVKLTDQEVTDVIAYLLTLKSPPPPK
jgi:cytochrome c2